MPRPFLLVALAGLTLASVAALAATGGGEPPRPQRIVSMNLCADQYLLALADRDRIAGLTRNAADPAMSAAWREARGLRILGSSAEEILVIEPDLVVGMPPGWRWALGGLSPDHRVLDLDIADSYDDIVAQVREVAAAIGEPARGERLVAEMDAALAALPRGAKAGVAAYYQRRGYLTGTGTLVDELMTRAGLENLAGRLGRPVLSQLSLEELIAAEPDFLIVESGTLTIDDQGSEMLHHPALRDIPRIVLPQAWTVCGGPAYVRAAQALSEQLARHRRQQMGGDGGRTHQKTARMPA